MRAAAVLFLALLALRYGLAWLCFGGLYAPTHDNLDSVVVYSVVAGRFWASGFDAGVFDVFAGGSTPWYFYTQSLSPQTLFYALLPPEIAYFTNEIIGLALGFFGMLLLLERLDTPPRWTLFLSALFAFSASFSTLGLGYLAAPFLFWLAIRPARPNALAWGIVALIGASSGLAIHGFFLPFALLAFLWLAHHWSHVARAFLIAMTFLAASFIAALGVTYAALFGPPSHRVDMGQDAAVPSPLDLLGELAAQLTLLSGQAHSVVLPGLFALPFLIAILIRRHKPARAIGWKLLVLFVAVALLTGFEDVIEQNAPGPLASVQVARLGLYLPLLTLLGAALALHGAPRVASRRTVAIAGGVYGVLAMAAMSGLNPSTLKSAIPERLHSAIIEDVKDKGVGALLSPAFYRQHGITLSALAKGGETFQSHFRPDQFDCVAANLPEGRVLSLGLDPMIAPYHGIPASAGYHNFYPLSYKQAFRPVIAEQLPHSRKGPSYFDDWGSRLNSFVVDPGVIHLDFAAARSLGAGALLSAFELPASFGSATLCGEDSPVFIYELSSPAPRPVSDQ